ncbi:DUF2585 family protein [Rhodopirellula sp. P2]|uniref:DUF2585 family protein n=1 Tax=Rhodopirellula sp. P2 TaxID=2127060 RepID=UPI0023675609|nr:DUF2585 family protein [Rhodopirellula sp. P2]WDQ17993.1 DUF2585 family protein [Rhodopirellula sp. P2]
MNTRSSDTLGNSHDRSRGDQSWRAASVAALMIAGMVLVLAGMGRQFWCECGAWVPWSWDIWTAHNSQHLIDPYFFSHVLHGVLFFWGLLWVPRLNRTWRFLIAVGLEVSWEILENSPLIIERYREATMAVGYTGDSIANSVTDVAACMLGYWFSSRFGWRWSVALFVLSEIVMLITIRDNLLLNVLMLVSPIPAIQEWQSV